jgi:glycosyltransferase involved in cell wall biosynthesis
MKPKILAILPGLIPSTLINVVTPLIDLHKEGRIVAQVTLETQVREKDVIGSDLIILCRNTDPERAHWFLNMMGNRKSYIYDIDDNFFELPEDSIFGRYYRSPERQGMLKEFIQRASLVRVYSTPMLERAVELNPNTVKVTGPVDWRLLSPVKENNEQKLVKIVYATSRVNDNLAEIFKPALKRILENYKDEIQVYFLGYNPVEFKTYKNVFFKPLTLNYEQYLRYFSGARFDIGLAPLMDDIFHRSKSNLKVREYGACRIAGIYSDVDVYSSSIAHRENGLLVNNTPDAWYDAIAELIENRDLRINIQKRAYLFARQNFSEEAFAEIWYRQIKDVLGQTLNNNPASAMMPALILQGKDSDLSSRSIFSQIQTWFGRKYSNLVAGLHSQGFGYIRLYFHAVVQTHIILFKIKLVLLFPRK